MQNNDPKAESTEFKGRRALVTGGTKVMLSNFVRAQSVTENTTELLQPLERPRVMVRKAREAECIVQPAALKILTR
jgi:hypothetical protein